MFSEIVKARRATENEAGPGRVVLWVGTRFTEYD